MEIKINNERLNQRLADLAAIGQSDQAWTMPPVDEDAGSHDASIKQFSLFRKGEGRAPQPSAAGPDQGSVDAR